MPVPDLTLIPQHESIHSRHGAIKIPVHHDTLSCGSTVWALPGCKKTPNRRYAQNVANIIESNLMADLSR